MMNSALGSFCCGWPEKTLQQKAQQLHTSIIIYWLPEELYSTVMDRNKCKCVTVHEMWICLTVQTICMALVCP